jgi:uncharacterized membrane protein
MNKQDIYLLLTTALVFTIVDLSVLMFLKPYFDEQVRKVQGSIIDLDLFASSLCYLFLVIGVFVILVLPRRSLLEAFLLGIFVYGVYELTNKSILRQWKWKTVLVDTLWGGTLFATTEAIVLSLFDKSFRILPVNMNTFL